MKVLCINNKPLPFLTNKMNHLLVEGETYTVSCTTIGFIKGGEFTEGYNLKELDVVGFVFHPSRFIPLSEIDELELHNTKELSL